ncbi:MAG: hypothetical protein IV094_11170 [Vitreoscilla sp.]|nr:hypothetical protein [Vitreoscilla sp.]
MNTRFAGTALCACVLWLGACDKTPTSPPTPIVNATVPTESGATAGAVANPSVPSAESVLPPATATKADPTLGRSNSTMSAAQESTAMPMPGQNNDHSAPLGPAKPASAP